MCFLVLFGYCWGHAGNTVRARREVCSCRFVFGPLRSVVVRTQKGFGFLFLTFSCSLFCLPAKKLQ